MSSILDAIHEIEHRQGTPAVAVPASLPEPKPARLPVLGGALALVLTALATLSMPLWRATAPATPAASTSAVADAATLPEVPARPAVHAESMTTERPRAVRKTAAAKRRDAAAARMQTATAGTTHDDAAGDAPEAGTAATRRVAAPRATSPTRGGGVHLESLSYSPSRSARSAVLVVGGARHVLHEGESRGDVAVQLIMHDRVYVAEGGNVFALEAPR